MAALSERVDELLRAPAAAAFFVHAAAEGLGPDELADPAEASILASRALVELWPWTDEAAGNRVRYPQQAAGLRDLVTAVATDPRNAWWTAPLDRTAQLRLVDRGDKPADPTALVAPTGPITGWEIYAQKPERSVTTSTELDVPPGRPVRTGAHAVLAHGITDWTPDYPVLQTRLDIASGARVHEIHSAADWHDLALRYGDRSTYPGSDHYLREATGIDNGLAPVWSAVAADFDGVHLSFAGLLTSLYVPVVTDGVTTTHWAREWESTCWLRPVFTGVTRLPDLLG
jgi:hypothetical protein